MATAKEKALEDRLQQVEALLRQAGLTAPPVQSDDPKDRPDYIGYGTPEHATFIGLILVTDPEEADGRTVYTSRQTKQMYCLEDERVALTYCPGMSREDAVYTTLREKVGEFEAGEPPISERAPTMWTPDPLGI